MMPDVWEAVAGLLLALGAIAGWLALFKVAKWWSLAILGIRLMGLAALAVALYLAIAAHGQWSVQDLRQVTLALATATLGIHLVLAWRLRMGSAGPIVDMVALLLILLDMILIRPGGPLLTCFQRSIPFQVQWLLFLIGSGGVLVAGSAACALALQRGIAGRLQGPLLLDPIDLHAMLAHALFLSLVTLGGGLAVAVWWAWRTLGSLSAGDPRHDWMAITWLLAAMSLVAWRLDRHAGWWAAGMAVLATSAALFGLLAFADLHYLLGM